MDVFGFLVVINVFTKIVYFCCFETGLASYFVGELGIYILPTLFRANNIWNSGNPDRYLGPCQTPKMDLVCENS